MRVDVGSDYFAVKIVDTTIVVLLVVAFAVAVALEVLGWSSG